MRKKMILFIGVASIVAMLTIPLIAEEGKSKHSGHKAKTSDTEKVSAKCQGGRKMCANRLQDAIKAMDAAIEAINKDDKDAALASIKKARKIVATSREAMLQMGRPVNARCPMKGSKLDPDNVPENLTRTYMGKKIGFCCAGCPTAWDKLSKEEQSDKLSKEEQADKLSKEKQADKLKKSCNADSKHTPAQKEKKSKHDGHGSRH